MIMIATQFKIFDFRGQEDGGGGVLAEDNRNVIIHQARFYIFNFPPKISNFPNFYIWLDDMGGNHKAVVS